MGWHRVGGKHNVEIIALIDASILPAARMVLVFAIVFAAGVLRGYTGFGFALAAAPMLALIVPPVRVVPLVLCLEIVASAQMLSGLWREVHFRSVAWLGLGSLVGVPLGLWGLAMLPADVMRLAIALTVLVSVAGLVAGLRFRRPPGGGTTLLVGALSGLFNGGAAMGGPPVILFYLGAQTAVSVGRASLVFYFSLIDLAAAVLAAASGLLTTPLAILAALCVPVLLAGQAIGTRLFHSSLQRHYRAVAIVVLTAVGLAVLMQSVAQLWVR